MHWQQKKAFAAKIFTLFILFIGDVKRQTLIKIEHNRVKWLVKFAQILNSLLPTSHFPSITKHLGKIRLHMAFNI